MPTPIENKIYYWNLSHPELVYLVANFERKLETTDLTEDYQLFDGAREEACWAYGNIESGNLASHGTNQLWRGHFYMNLFSINSAQVIIGSLFVTFAGLLYALLQI